MTFVLVFCHSQPGSGTSTGNAPPSYPPTLTESPSLQIPLLWVLAFFLSPTAPISLPLFYAGIDLFMEHNKNRKDGKDVGGRPTKEADEANTLAATLVCLGVVRAREEDDSTAFMTEKEVERTKSELEQKGFSPRIMDAVIASTNKMLGDDAPYSYVAPSPSEKAIQFQESEELLREVVHVVTHQLPPDPNQRPCKIGGKKVGRHGCKEGYELHQAVMRCGMNDEQMVDHIKDSPEYKEYTKKCLHNKLPIVLLNRQKFAEWKCPCIKYERPMECVNDIRSNAQKVVRALQTTLRRFLNWKLETRSTRGSIEKVLTEDEIESVREFIRMLDSEKTVMEASTCDSKEYSGLNNYEGEPYKAATPKCAG